MASISKKIITPLLIGGGAVTGAMSLYIYFQFPKIKSQVYKEQESQLKTFYEQKMEEKRSVGITNAINVANNLSIIKALKENNRSLALGSLKKMLQEFRQYTKYKNIKIHIHTKDIHSFLRVWKPTKYGDDLSSFRKTIVAIKRDKKPLSAIEVGRAGLLLRGLAPVIEDNQYLGSVEFIQGLNSISKDAQKRGYEVIILMDRAYAKTSNFINSTKKVQNFLVVTKDGNYDPNLLLDLQNNGLKKITSNYFLIRYPIKDFSGKKVGIAIIAEPIKKVHAVIEKTDDMLENLFYIMVTLDIIILILLLIILHKVVISPINLLKERAKELTQGDADLTREIKIGSKDELEESAHYVNRFIQIIRNILKHIVSLISQEKDMVYTLQNHSQKTFTSVQRQLKVIEDNNKLSFLAKELISDTQNSIHTTTDTISQTNRLLFTMQDKLSKMADVIKKDSQEANSVAQNIEQLSNHTKEIQRVLEFINDIAEQTNMLALNASIEAARAGEMGKGFSVVADEVRKLAEKTQQSLLEINEVVNSIIEGIQNSAKTIQKLAINSQNSSSITQDIVQEANSSANQMHQTLTIAQKALENINKTQSLFQKLSQQNQELATVARDNEDIAKELQELSENLTNIVKTIEEETQRFKL